jgi:hypothetical protein
LHAPVSTCCGFSSQTGNSLPVLCGANGTVPVVMCLAEGFVPKGNGRDAEASRPFFQSLSGLQRLNVGGLQALGTADDLKLDRLAVVQGLVAIRLNRGEMDENVLPALALDEAKALAGIEPLDCSLFFTHFSFSLFNKAIWCPSFRIPLTAVLRQYHGNLSICSCVLWIRDAGTKKGREFDLATASQLQRRYKSNKRKYSIAGTHGFCKLFLSSLRRKLKQTPATMQFEMNCLALSRVTENFRLRFAVLQEGPLLRKMVLVRDHQHQPNHVAFFR